MTTAAATAEMEYATAKTSVWWDIENCEVPRAHDAYAVAQNVNSALKKMEYRGPVSITAYGDTTLIPLHVQQALSSTGVGLNHVPAGVKDASDKKILVDMLLWAIDNPAPANFMLISGDRDFSYALHQLRMRRYNILLAQPAQASVPLVAAAKDVWLWTGLASGGPPLTSIESSRLLNNGRCQISNIEVSKPRVSEPAPSSKQIDSTSAARENHVPRGLPQETRRNMFQNGRVATGEFVDSRGTQASVSANPIQEELVECKVCQIFCSSKDAYKKHSYGKRHRNNLESQSGKSNSISVGPVVRPKDVREKQKMMVNEFRAMSSNVNQRWACRLCNVVCQSQIVFDSHLKGKKHAEMLSQPEAIIDSKKGQEKVVGENDQPKETIVSQKEQLKETVAEPKPNAEYVCRMCNVTCPSQIVFDSHLRGQKHAAAMLSQSELDQALIESKKLQEKVGEPKPKAEHIRRMCNVACHSQIIFDSHLRGKKHVAMLSQSEALIDSKKIQEKGVEETVVELQLQSQNAQENSNCLEKHVVMVNQSEALNNSSKIEENVVQEKAQPTVAENQLQSQNTQEKVPLYFSESSIKEYLASTKDQVYAVNRRLPNGEVPREASECFDGIGKPVNTSEGATEHSGKVNQKQKEVVVPRAGPAASNLCAVICDRQRHQGLSTVVCDDNKGHRTNQKHTKTAASVAINGSQSSVPTKPIKQPEDLQPVWCQVCEISCINKVAYANHTYGKKHRQQLELQSVLARVSKENAEKKETRKVVCQNQTVFDSPLRSQNHPAMVKGHAEDLVESRKIQEEEQALEKINDEEPKEINAISESSKCAFTELKRESLVNKESRHSLDVSQDVNLTDKSEDAAKLDPKPKSAEPENESVGRKEHQGETEGNKGQADNFWTRLWGKKS